MSTYPRRINLNLNENEMQRYRYFEGFASATSCDVGGFMPELPEGIDTLYSVKEVNARLRNIASWLRNGCSVTHAIEELELLAGEHHE